MPNGDSEIALDTSIGSPMLIHPEQIQALALKIAADETIEQIVLFGSYASGRATPDSDVDLLVVAPHTGKPWHFAARIRSRIGPTFPLDIIVRSPEQLRNRLAMGDPFLCDVLSSGKVLYEVNRG